MAGLLIAIIVWVLLSYLENTIKSDANDSYEDSSKAKDSSKSQNRSFYFEDVVVDVFIAVVKLTPDLHVLGDGVKERMREYALKAFEKIDSSAANTRTDHFASRINPKEHIKVKELQKKVSDKLNTTIFHIKKRFLSACGRLHTPMVRLHSTNKNSSLSSAKPWDCRTPLAIKWRRCSGNV